MIFKRVLSAFGAGGLSVDTLLSNPNTRPGSLLDGSVHLCGGEVDADIDQIVVALVTRVEIEAGDIERNAFVEFHRMPVAGRLWLPAGGALSIPFQLPVPWEAPITHVHGQQLYGMTLGLQTHVAVDRAVDKGDLDAVAVHPLPVQERILEAFARLGFRFKHADLEHGYIHGVQQTLPFYQEIEYFAAPQYAHSVNEIELTFVANPYTVEVILEADKRGGIFTSGHDTYGRYVVEHGSADQIDWTQQVDEWLHQLIAGRGAHGHHSPGYHSPYSPPAPHGHHGYGGGSGSGLGSGIAGAVAGGALGFAGGLIAGEVLEEVFDDVFSDEE
ncbi:MAG TPA: sporulation protein [Micromonosporaceae bacterium]|nr:sporulation protein [Micromonosporaceae bacterium]